MSIDTKTVNNLSFSLDWGKNYNSYRPPNVYFVLSTNWNSSSKVLYAMTLLTNASGQFVAGGRLNKEVSEPNE